MSIYRVDDSSITTLTLRFNAFAANVTCSSCTKHTTQTRQNTPHKQLKETVGFKAGKRKNAGMNVWEGEKTAEQQEEARGKERQTETEGRRNNGDNCQFKTIESTVKLHHTKEIITMILMRLKREQMVSSLHLQRERKKSNKSSLHKYFRRDPNNMQ